MELYISEANEEGSKISEPEKNDSSDFDYAVKGCHSNDVTQPSVLLSHKKEHQWPVILNPSQISQKKKKNLSLPRTDNLKT